MQTGDSGVALKSLAKGLGGNPRSTSITVGFSMDLYSCTRRTADHKRIGPPRRDD
jgi:hypothetical protein